MSGSNNAPVVSGVVSVTGTEDQPVTVTLAELLALATDPDGDPLSISGLSASSGVLIDNGDDTWTLTPDQDFNGSLTLSYTVEDGNGGATPASASVTLSAVNDAPVISGPNVDVTEGGTSVLSVQDLGITDLDDPDADITVSVSNLANGQFERTTAPGTSITSFTLQEVADGTIVFVHDGGEAAPTFSIQATDASGADSGTPTAVSISFTSVNDAPLVSAISQTTNEDAPSFSVDLLSTAGDADQSDTLSVNTLVQTGGRAASAALVGSTLSFDPSLFNDLAVGETEILTFTYNVNDGTVDVANTLTVTVEGRNDAPTVSAITQTTNEDATYVLDLLSVASDPDLTDTLSVNTLVQTGGRAVSATLTGSTLSFDPSLFTDLDTGESEVLTFTYNVNDGTVDLANTVTVTVEGRNDAPIVTAIAQTTNEDAGSFSADLLSTASDVDPNDTLSVNTLVQTGGRPVAATLAGSTVSFDPSLFNDLAAGESETVSFSYNVSDGTVNVANTLSVTVEGRNDAPSVAAITQTTNEDAAYSVDLLSSASDADVSDVLSVNTLVQTGGRPVSAALVGSDLSFDPALFNDLAVGESEILTFSYNVNDGTVDVANTLTVTVEGRNDAPVAPGGRIVLPEDNPAISHVLAGFDPDTSDTVSFSLVSGPANGSVTVNPDGTYTFTPNAGFTGSDSFIYRVTGSSGLSTNGTMSIDVDGTTEGRPAAIVASVNDPAGLDTRVAAMPNGGYVVIWDTIGDGSGTGVRGKIFDAEGQAVGTDFPINATTTGTQMDPSVTVLNNGDVVVAWQTTGAHDIFFRRFNASGTPLDAADQAAPNDQSGILTHSNVRALSNGGFVVSWSDHSTGVEARFFDSNGNAVTGDILISDQNEATSDSRTSLATELPNGNVLFTYHNGNEPNLETFGRIFTSAGVALGPSFQINDTTVGRQATRDVAVLSDGGFVVGYTDLDSETSNGMDFRGRRFTADGTPVGGSFLLHPGATDGKQTGRMLGLPDGGFIAFFSTQDQPGDAGFGSVIQRFDANMQAVGGPISVNQTTLEDEFAMSIDLLADGRIVTQIRNANTGEQDTVTRILGDEFGISVNRSITGTQGNDILAGDTGNDVITGAVAMTFCKAGAETTRSTEARATRTSRCFPAVPPTTPLISIRITLSPSRTCRPALTGTTESKPSPMSKSSGLPTGTSTYRCSKSIR